MANYFDLQEKNRKRSRIIVVCFVLFFIWLGAGLDLALFFWSKGMFPPVFTLIVGLTGLLVARWSLKNAAGTILKAMLARPADRHRNQGEQTFINIVEEMCIAASMRRPKVWIIPDPDPNAMAVGLTEGDYHIAVTEGLLQVLTREEIQGVIAHEIAHLKNQDTRLMTTLSVLVGVAALISEFVCRSRFYASDIESDDSDSKIGGIIFLIWLLSALIAPLVTRLMALMVSREREYLADASAAQFTRNPQALAHALEKIAAASAPTALVKAGSAHLCIASPTASDLNDGCDTSWFATHPPIRMRIHRLMTIGSFLAAGNKAPTGQGLTQQD